MLHITYPLYQTCSSALLCSMSTLLSLSWFQPHFPFHHPQTPTNSNRSLSFYLYIWCILKTIKNEESKMNLPFFVVENSWILPKFQLNLLVLIVQLQRTRPCWPWVAGSSWRRRRRENLKCCYTFGPLQEEYIQWIQCDRFSENPLFALMDH